MSEIAMAGKYTAGQPQKARLAAKIIWEGTLVLASPLQIGAGGSTAAHEKDITVLKDRQGHPFIPGTSLAGVWREALMGYDEQLAQTLFGDIQSRSGAAAGQSLLAIDDVWLEGANIIMRDGVHIDSFTGSAVETGKYDYELVDAGARGHFYVEMTLRQAQLDGQGKIDSRLLEALAWLRREQAEGLAFGAMTTKGFGRIKSERDAAGLYDFRQPAAVAAWLRTPDHTAAGAGIHLEMATAAETKNDFVVEAGFALEGSLIVRDYNVSREENEANISAHMRQGQGGYIIPGPSVKGVLRHEAERILRRLGRTQTEVDAELAGLMGKSTDEDGSAVKVKSRFYVQEGEVHGGAVLELPQTRNRIDRFTGGTMDTALFTTKPIWQKESGKESVVLRFRIKDATQQEAGLALYMLRDVWQGRVAFGGERGIGRGVLQGLRATIRYQKKEWELDSSGRVQGDSLDQLNKYARAFISKEAE